MQKQFADRKKKEICEKNKEEVKKCIYVVTTARFLKLRKIEKNYMKKQGKMGKLWPIFGEY